MPPKIQLGSDFEDVQFLGLSSVDKAYTTTTTILREARWRIELLGLTNFQLYWLDWLDWLKEKLPELNGQYFYVLITRDWHSLDFTSFVQSVVVCTSIILLKPIPDKYKFTVYLFVT